MMCMRMFLLISIYKTAAVSPNLAGLLMMPQPIAAATFRYAIDIGVDGSKLRRMILRCGFRAAAGWRVVGGGCFRQERFAGKQRHHDVSAPDVAVHRWRL
nr:hypothetical protein Itr_chr14CG02480 [Ipomoea trifida]